MERNVVVEPDIMAVSFALSQPSRCAILQALMGGVALPASELAFRAGISNATTSAHLRNLEDAGLIRAIRTGRHRYYELTSHLVAEIVEALSVLAPKRELQNRKAGPKHLHHARLCYDHLAGEVGVQLTNAMIEKKIIRREGELFEICKNGHHFFAHLGVDLHEVEKSRRCFARICVDWSERQPHLAGALGAALTNILIDRGWIARNRDDRSVSVTDTGRRSFGEIFGVHIT